MDQSMLNQLKARFQYDHESGEIQSKSRRSPCGKYASVGHLNANGYIDICVMGKTIKGHRVAWFLVHGVWPSQYLDIDHMNGIKHDNRMTNLRLVSRTINAQNRKNAWSKKANKLIGVYFIASKKQKPWRAALKVMGRLMDLGQFETEEEAYSAYLDAKLIYHTGFVQ